MLGCCYTRRNILLKGLLHPCTVIAVIACAREITLHRVRNINLMFFLRIDDFVLQPKLYVVQNEVISGVEFRPLRAEVIVRILCPALRLCTVIDNDLVGVEFKAFARHIVGTGLAVRLLHRPRVLLIVIVDAIAVERNTRHSLRQLKHMCTIGNGDIPRPRIALDIVSLKAPHLKLNNIHMPLCGKLSRALIIGQVVALKRNGRGLICGNGMAQVFLQGCCIGEQLLLLRREAICTCFTTFILDEIQMLKSRVRVPIVRCVCCTRQNRTCGGQCEQNTRSKGCGHRRVLLSFRCLLKVI